MLVGFDTEFGFTSVRRINGRFESDITTGRPVCACLAFEDGRELRFTGNWDGLEEILNDPRYTPVVHGAHAEMMFCRMVGIRFPDRYVDTLLRGVLLAHATTFSPFDKAYGQAGLANLTMRFNIPFIGADDKDAIRESILCLQHEREFGMVAVLNYCLADARACLQLVNPLRIVFQAKCGLNADRNLEVLYQPYARAMAEVANKGLRFDSDGWERLREAATKYRGRQLRIMREHGYNHDGDGLGLNAFSRMICQIGLDRVWPRTPNSKEFCTREADLRKRRYLHDAIGAAHRLIQSDALLRQRLGERVDRDGRLRCGILPFAQRSSRNSTVRPNIGGMPGVLRPLLLPDDGCVFVHFDFSQQEPGVAGYLSQDEGLLADFTNGDVYTNTGRRMGLITGAMSVDEIKRIRGGLLKTLMLSIIYGKSAVGIARDLPCSWHDAQLHLILFERTYPRLSAWLRSYVNVSMLKGWGENIIGLRAAFDVQDPGQRSHVARSCQNFPIQSSAAACFQITGLHLAEFGADVRLPIHDAYLLNVPNDPRAIAGAREQIVAATDAATNQLFPGLAVKREIETLSKFAKDSKVNSLDNLLVSLGREGEVPCQIG